MLVSQTYSQCPGGLPFVGDAMPLSSLCVTVSENWKLVQYHQIAIAYAIRAMGGCACVGCVGLTQVSFRGITIKVG